MGKDTVLLVIDVQLAIFEPGEDGHGLFEPQRLLANIGILLERARVKGIPVIYIQQTDDYESPFALGHPLRDIHPAIAPMPGELVVPKAYPDSFHDTVLKEKLDAMGVKKLVICGLQSEYCLDSTVRRAFSLGYEVTLASDAHSTKDTPVLSAAQIIAHTNYTFHECFALCKKADEVTF